MSEYHGKYYNPSHEDDYGSYMSGQCDCNQVDSCKAMSKIKGFKLCEKCPFPDNIANSIPSNNGKEDNQ